MYSFSERYGEPFLYFSTSKYIAREEPHGVSISFFIYLFIYLYFETSMCGPSSPGIALQIMLALNSKILLPLPLKCWDYRPVLPPTSQMMFLNNSFLKNNIHIWVWWYTSLIPAFRRQKQVNLSEFKATLDYRVSPGQLGLSQKIKQTKTNKNKK